MTYITAWKNKTSVFMVADSAITYLTKEGVDTHAKIWDDVSTFGENHILTDDKVVQEEWFKIYNIEDKILLCFATDNIRKVYDAIGLLKCSLEYKEWKDIRDCLKYAFQDNFQGKITIIASFIENGTPILVSVNGNEEIGFKEHSIFEVVYGGDVTQEFISHTENLCKELITKNYTDDENLVVLCSLIQSYKYVKNLMGIGIGGFISGARIDNLGIHWQKDIAYIPFNCNYTHIPEDLSRFFDKAKITSILVRDNLVFISNPYTHTQSRPFGNYQPINILESQESQDKRIE